MIRKQFIYPLYMLQRAATSNEICCAPLVVAIVASWPQGIYYLFFSLHTTAWIYPKNVNNVKANWFFESRRKVYSWFQCCVYTLIFRHDSTVMIRPSWFDREVTKQYSILPWISYRNQSTQSESYFNDSLNVSLVIQKKRTVIHNLFSFSDNSLSYKSRNLIASHRACGRLDQ